MKILHTSDWHLGKKLDGFSRQDEQQLFLQDFVKIVQQNDIDLVIIAGDVYDTSTPPAFAEKMFYDTLKQISNNGKTLTLVIAGNHDSPERLTSATPLAMEHGIIMIGTPKTVVPIGNYGNHQLLNSGEGFIEIKINDENAIILTVPYPSEKRLNEILYEEMTSENDQKQSYTDRIKELFSTLEDNYRDDTINLAVSHLFAMGSEEGGSERSIQLGGSYIVDGKCLPQNAQYIALGHVHKPQIVPSTNKKARYCGSPLHYNKKEISYEKKCFLVEIAPNTDAQITEIPLKVYKPIEIWRCVGIDDAINKCSENAQKDCWVYLEIETDEYISEQQIKNLKSIKKDIVEIAPIIKNQTYTSNLTQQEKDQLSFEELFCEFYKVQRSVEPTNELKNLFLEIMEMDNETN
ncbi:MAG: exonuclease SbcCD subunit D [Epulopiscium sp. Nele67-Bin005]|nr:MAG: exonuclease SbcCD subunit D [Epulopiscium sp. Nele67-Bin005]